MNNKITTNLSIVTVLILFVIAIFCCEQAVSNSYSPYAYANHNQLWPKLGDNFQWQHPYNNERVKSFITHYKSNPYHVKKLSEYATPYIYHVVSELEKHGLPGELAIIPMIESAYRPNATSCVGATGIWQLTADTAKRFGVKQDQWYDGRKDITDSTKAAIDLLRYLNQKFDGDWLLALAAYNTGEANVRKAIRRNKNNGLPVAFWNLKLPKETTQFVPKILAIAYLIKHPEEVGIKLNTVHNKPYFAEVKLKSQIDLRVAANLAEIPIKELKMLNPGYSKLLTHPKGPHKLHLPTQNVEKFNANFSKKMNKSVEKSTSIPYTVKPGDSLSKIALNHNTTINNIKSANKLSGSDIIAGKQLIIPIGKLQKNT